MVSLSLGYPNQEDELNLWSGVRTQAALAELRVSSVRLMLSLQRCVEEVRPGAVAAHRIS